MNQAAIALLAVTLANFINSLGYIFFKFAHIRMERNKDNKQYYFLTWQFICGLLLIILAAAINVGKYSSHQFLFSLIKINWLFIVVVVSIAYADQITLTSTSSLTLVFNSILATRLLGEGPLFVSYFPTMNQYCLQSQELLETFLSKEREDIQEKKRLNQNRQSLIKHFSFEEDNIGSPRSQCRESDSDRVEQISRFRSQIQRPQNDFDQASNSNTNSIYNATTDKDGSQIPFKTTQQTQFDFVRTPTYNSLKDENEKDCEKCPKYDVGGQFKGCNDEPTITQLIDRVSKMDEKDLKKLSPNFQKFWIRLPLILYPWASGLLSGMTTSFIKGVAEITKNHTMYELATHPLPYICLAICGFNIIGQLYTLNTGLKFYNQLEVIPIYQSSVILNNLLCGGLIFNEFQYYSWWNMLLIALGSVTCICGIMIIAKKYQFISSKEAEKSALRLENKDNQIDMIFFSQNGSDGKARGDLQGHYQRI
ncbi:phospholipase d [Stylonychia lemnae]|uniref:Phospholipase d n=1 Tax=Stylonychia lemnae TaxID=5949 RepID=A0A077ZQH0_STYLE|nr:phospholipase d [Stylonychia lemnae]|eukprot:CDW72158.1 phospholipase d [Stylonychia lemnae]